jgi:hypothetical protein
MAKRFFIKCDNESGIPSRWEMSDFENKNGLSVNEVARLYVTFKVKKRRKIKRLRINVKSYPCEYCGFHAYASGKVGTVEFDKELY